MRGGPKDISRLYSLDEIKRDFGGLEQMMCEEEQVELSEGDWHKGRAEVIHYIGRKPLVNYKF